MKDDFYRLLDEQTRDALEQQKSNMQEQLDLEKDSVVEEFTRQQEQLGTWSLRKCFVLHHFYY